MPRVPLTPAMTVGEAFEAAVRAAGDAWLGGDDERVTLGELARRADALAGRLHAAGLGPGDRAGLLLPNGVHYAEAFFAAVRLGAVVVPLDARLSARELEGAAHAVPLDVVFAEEPHPAPGRLDVTTAADGWHVPDAVGPAVAPAVRPRRDEPAAVFFTSGTTGDPKPVTLTHRQLVRSLLALRRLHAAFFSGSPAQQARRLATVARRHGTALLGAAGRQTWLTTSPFSSIAGHQVLSGSLLLGHNLLTSRSFHPRRTLEAVDTHRVNVLAGTPAMLELLLRVDNLSPYDLSSLLVVGVGGGPAAPDLADRARERFDCAVTIGYGSTELGGGVLATRIEDPAQVQGSTVGRPFPGTEVRIVDEQGEDVAPGQPGELLCRADGDGSTDGSADGGAAAAGPPWLHTGDLAVRDGDGNVRILGRKDDLVVRGGQNVHPLEVERVIETVPGVRGCGVVGVPFRGDHEVWAFVVPEEGHGVTVDDVRRHCRNHLLPYKQPGRVRIVESIPATEQGETRRNVLRDLALAEIAAAGAREETPS